MAKKYFIIAIIVSLGFFVFLNFSRPIKIQGDGVFYYSYLHAVVFNHSLDVHDELSYFSAYDSGSQWFIQNNIKTPTGHTPNAYAWGTAIFWLPFIFIATLITWIANFFGHNLSLDGYSYWYVMAVNFGTLVAGFLVLWINYKIVRRLFDEKSAVKSLALILLATPFIYYQFFEPSMSHIISLFLVSTFIYLVFSEWLDYQRHPWLLALVVFLMIATRWQNAIFCVLYLPIILRTAKISIPNSLIQAFKFVLPVAIFAVIQGLLWHYLYGSYFLTPQGVRFIRPEFHGLYTLFSSDRGLLLWSPVLILAIIGWPWLWIKSKFLAIMAVLIFVGQWILNSSLNDLGGGDAFGGRRFIELLPFFALTLTALVERFGQYIRAWRLVIVVFIFWNLLLVENYRLGFIQHSGTFNVFRVNYFQAVERDYNHFIHK
ncbi:MAG: hypothetical protein WCP18_03615 [bacterium]